MTANLFGRLIAFMIAFAWVGAVQAQSLVGRSVVNGRQVDLFSDFSWRYSAPLSEECMTITKSVRFCPEKGVWDRLPPPNTEADAFFSNRLGVYLVFIDDELGQTAGLNLDSFASIVIGNAAIGMGKAPAEVPVLGMTDFTFEGAPARTLTYLAARDGLNVVMLNTLRLGKTNGLQVIAFELGVEPSDRPKEAKLKALSQVFVEQ